MVWGCMSVARLGLICKIEGRMNSFAYCDILEANLYGNFAKYHLNPSMDIFQHDNDPKHISIKMINQNERVAIEATFQCLKVTCTII
jgi:hypothetical protein